MGSEPARRRQPTDNRRAMISIAFPTWIGARAATSMKQIPSSGTV